MLKQFALFISLFQVFFSMAWAQQKTDTVSLTTQQAEGIFLAKNLSLIAARYNIDINNAYVQQARYWDNPVINTDQNIWDGGFFRYKRPSSQYPNGLGQVYFQFQQVLVTAGKREKLVQLAKLNTGSAEQQFYELMRNLRFVLVTDLNNLYMLQSMETVYVQELKTLETLSAGMDEMLKVGNVSQKDNVRIKSLVFALQSEYNDNLRQQQDLQKEINTLLQFPESTFVKSGSGSLLQPSLINTMNVTTLIDSAYQSRPDLASAKIQRLYNVQNLSLQHALAVPDITVGPNYDMRNSYVPNYVGLSLSLPLPLWNKNKGNIKAAQISIAQAGTVVEQVQNTIANEVAVAFRKLRVSSEMMNNMNLQWQEKYEDLFQNMLRSYKERQVSLVEFVDFFDSYKNTRLLVLQQGCNMRNAAAEVNFVTNTNFFKL